MSSWSGYAARPASTGGRSASRRPGRLLLRVRRRVRARHARAPAPAAVGRHRLELAHAAMLPVRGHPMSKSALETGRAGRPAARGGSLAGDVPGSRAARRSTAASRSASPLTTCPTGCSLLEEVAEYLASGYRRIKLKIKPGWDLEPRARGPRALRPDIPLQVDANAAYTLAEHRPLAELDAFDLLLIEQPLPEDDLVGHAAAGEAAPDADLPGRVDRLAPRCGGRAIALGACRDHQHQAGSGRGLPGGARDPRPLPRARRRRSGAAACSRPASAGPRTSRSPRCPASRLPGDTRASDRYYAHDLTAPFVLADGRIAVPEGPGIGVQPLDIASLAYWHEELRPS